MKVKESFDYIASYKPFWAVKNDPVSTKNITGQDGSISRVLALSAVLRTGHSDVFLQFQHRGVQTSKSLGVTTINNSLLDKSKVRGTGSQKL